MLQDPHLCKVKGVGAQILGSSYHAADLIDQAINAGEVQEKNLFCCDSHPLEHWEVGSAPTLLVFLKTWLCKLAWVSDEGIPC